MKVNEKLVKIDVVLNENTVKTVKIDNPCQMWKNLDGLFEEFGHDATVLVLRADGTEYKHFTHKQLKNGKYIKINAIKETNRAQVAKRKAKLAKRREYDRKRRAAKKLQKQQTEANT